MRVLIVHNQLWAHYKSKLFSELHRLAPQYGVEIHVAQIALSEKSRDNMGTAEAFRYDYDYEVLFNTSLDQIKLWPRTKALLKKIRTYRPDVLNLTGWYDPAQWVLLFYAKLVGIKVVISNESNVRDHVRMGAKERFKQFLLKQANGFFCFGQSSAAYLEKLGVNPSQILTRKAAVVDNDVILEHYQKAIPEREKRKQQKGWVTYNFIFVGRLIPPKNLVMLLEAFAEISKENEDWGLVLLGEGEQKSKLQQLAQNIKNVRFEAGVPWYEVAEYLALANVLVLPSESEPWGLVVNEAMICGLPVLVSEPSGCVEDLVRVGQNGFTFDPRQKQDLVAKMHYFVENAASLSRMGEASRQIVASFAPEKVAHEMLRGMVNL
ncbi:glycosyltransferase family 4 protein [Runella sp.]|uniref:glycosyltransferase family 4 protein n=1 Tax=Runella sp. TaxID=1960881 RepID=UPI003D133EB1